MVGRLPSGLWKGSGDGEHVAMALVSSHTTPSEAASLQRDGVACDDVREASAQRWYTARLWCHPPKYSVGDCFIHSVSNKQSWWVQAGVTSRAITSTCDSMITILTIWVSLGLEVYIGHTQNTFNTCSLITLNYSYHLSTSDSLCQRRGIFL